MNILLVEDDFRMAAALATALKRHGYQVIHASSCQEARRVTGYDLMLLDLTLPDGDGVDFCRSLRTYSSVPIIMVSARDSARERILGLRSGADDYMIKPFNAAELEARIQAVMRRPRASMNVLIMVADLTLDLASRKVERAGRPVDLTPKELALLARLAENKGKIVSREQLLLEIWHNSSKAAARTLDVHITHLRSKIGKPDLLETVRGVGYRLGEID